MNNLQDLNEILFKQIERLDNSDLTDDEFQREVGKSDAIVKVANVVLANAGLMQENKNLRRRLADRESYD